MPPPSVRLFEVFTSIEGEGILYGTKTLFVRLAGCPFTCFYCDTAEALPLDSGTEYTAGDAAALIDDSLQDHTYKVNFTGGDPLIQHEAVAALAEHIRDKYRGSILTYLESSCFDAERFAHVLPHIDIAKIEFKTRDSGFVDSEQHHERMTRQALLCLRQAVSAGKTTFVKIVASSRTTVGEIRGLASEIFDIVRELGEEEEGAASTAAASGAISGFVIQPVYGKGEPPLELLLEMYDVVRPIYPDVRVVPQLHKIIGAP